MSLSIRLPLLLSLLVLACAARTVPDDAAGGSGGQSGERGDQGGTHVGGTAGGGRSAGGTGGTLPRGGAGGAAGRDGTSGTVGRGGSAGTSGDDAGSGEPGGGGGEPGVGGEGGDGDRPDGKGGASGAGGMSRGGTAGIGGVSGGGNAGSGGGSQQGFDLSIQQYVRDYYVVGYPGEVVIIVRNEGPMPAPFGVVVTDLPDSLVAVARGRDNGWQWTCSANSGAFGCSYQEEIPPNGVVGLVLGLTASTDDGAPFRNTARLTALGDSNASNDVSVETLIVKKLVDLALEVDFPPYATTVGVTVTNVGQNPTFAPIEAFCGGGNNTSASYTPVGSGWDCVYNVLSSTVACASDVLLDPGGTLHFTFPVYTDHGATGGMYCEIRTEADANLENNIVEIRL